MASLRLSSTNARLRCVDSASRDRMSSLNANGGDDVFSCRTASGRQATTCSSFEGWPSEMSGRSLTGNEACLDRRRRAAVFTWSISEPSEFGPGLQGSCIQRHSRVSTASPLCPGSGMRYAGRKGSFKIRGCLSDFDGFLAPPPQRSTAYSSTPHRSLKTKASNDSFSIADGSPTRLQSIQSSITKAFSSMVLMLETLQSYALQMRSMLYYEDVESVAHVIHREMQASLLWLFQQVFSCTPMLMIAVMVLFSDFTVHSAVTNLSLSEVPLATVFSHSPASPSLRLAEVGTGPIFHRSSTDMDAGSHGAPSLGGDVGGRGGRTTSFVAPFDDGESLQRGASATTGVGSRYSSTPSIEERFQYQEAQEEKEDAASDDLSRLLESTLEQMKLKGGHAAGHLRLDQEVVRQLVAPVSIQLEKDDYACFDRTDLEYRYAIEQHPDNTMLLSNYAQFLYVVRRDFDRSETYFQRALRVDPTDGDIIGRYATFLWLGRKDKDGAERAYKAALASNPDNPYFSGSYAHFLWHSGEDESACPMV